VCASSGCNVLVIAADATLRSRLDRELAPAPLPAAIVTAELGSLGELRAAHPRIPIIAVGIARGQIAAALDAGADAAVAGDPAADELRARVRAIARRREPPLRVGPLELRPERRAVRLDGETLELTAREYEVLSLLASAPGRIFTKGELARCCRPGAACGPPGRALERSVSRLRRRLGRHAPMLVTAWGVGYRLAVPDSPLTVDRALGAR